MSVNLREAVAEFVGTAILVFFAVGSAVFGIDKIGAVGVALAFGLVLLALAYAIGPVSGCHVNPAVTLGVLLRGGITPARGGRLLGRPDRSAASPARRCCKLHDRLRQGQGPDRRAAARTTGGRRISGPAAPSCSRSS